MTDPWSFSRWRYWSRRWDKDRGQSTIKTSIYSRPKESPEVMRHLRLLCLLLSSACLSFIWKFNENISYLSLNSLVVIPTEEAIFVRLERGPKGATLVCSILWQKQHPNLVLYLHLFPDLRYNSQVVNTWSTSRVLPIVLAKCSNLPPKIANPLSWFECLLRCIHRVRGLQATVSRDNVEQQWNLSKHNWAHNLLCAPVMMQC